MWLFFALSMVGIAAAIFGLIKTYANKNVPKIVILVTVYAWLTAMMIIALVPMDVWATKQHLDTGAIGILWDVAYWSTQAATWMLLPFYQVYSEAGDFTVKKRCWTSVKENGILYGSVGVLGLIGIAILLFTHSLTLATLIGLGIFMSNAFGLTAGILLLGYGLIEIPRSMWLTSDPDTQLKWCVHRAGKYAEAVMRATAELEAVVTIVYANQKQMRRSDNLKPYMDIVAEYAERESPVKPSAMAQRTVDIDSLKAEDLEYNFDVDGLAALRRRVAYAINEYSGTRAQYVDVMLEAFELEDVIKCRQNHDYATRPPLQPDHDSPDTQAEPQRGAGFSPESNPLARPHRPWTRHLWIYKCVVRPTANKVFAVLLLGLSLGIIFAEATIPFDSPNLSPFSLAVIATDSEFGVQLLVLLPLAYICACCYYALFRINAFNYNKLIPHATTGAALMQNGSLMCRFAAPTCWNFYHILHFTAAQGYLTVFGQKMASMDVTIPNVNLNHYLPIVLLIQCSLVALNLWNRALNMCVSAKFRFNSDDVDDEYTVKGRLLVRKEQEAAMMGYTIGEVLHSAYFDLEFPTIASAGKAKSKGLFSFFNRGVNSASSPAASERPASAYYSTTATAAAARWGRGAAGDEKYGGRQPIDDSDSPTTSLLAAKYEQASTATGSSAEAGQNGLDGIFASLTGGGGGHARPATTPGSKGPGGGGASGSTTRLQVGDSGTSTPGPAARGQEKRSLLSRWGLS